QNADHSLAGHVVEDKESQSVNKQANEDVDHRVEQPVAAWWLLAEGDGHLVAGVARPGVHTWEGAQEQVIEPAIRLLGGPQKRRDGNGDRVLRDADKNNRSDQGVENPAQGAADRQNQEVLGQM